MGATGRQKPPICCVCVFVLRVAGGGRFIPEGESRRQEGKEKGVRGDGVKSREGDLGSESRSQ